MITTNDIGKQFTDRIFGNAVTLRALDTWEGVPMANVFDARMANPSRIPGLGNYWIEVSNLVPQEGK
jgi:hypothetical protein